MTSTIKWFNNTLGFGFIHNPDLNDGRDIFLHHTGFSARRKSDLVREGEPVQFEIEETPKGLKAIRVVRLAPPGGISAAANCGREFPHRHD
jgi:CspA family cold shock protein